MQHFQSILIVIGIVAIGGVLIHGYLLSRKEKMVKAASEKSSQEKLDNTDMFAEQTSSSVGKRAGDDVSNDAMIISDINNEIEPARIDFGDALDDEIETPVVLDTAIRGSEEDTEVDRAVDNKVEEAAVEVDPIEPSIATTADVAEAGKPQISDNETTDSVDAPTIEDNTEPTDLFIFNVSATEGNEIGGHELLQFFLTAGLRFGAMSIFHRHEHSDGTGAVLFSVANMMAPGVFDPESMEQFRSQGVSFFLTAPNDDIDITASFDMMLVAVEQMAEEFDCEVLNADREQMTEENFIEYRKRLLHYV